VCPFHPRLAADQAEDADSKMKPRSLRLRARRATKTLVMR
jgi:hypothetical protein